jgi:diguanylate cyclase (GGDEF)-like protein
MNDARRTDRFDPALQAALDKLEPADRAIVDEALSRAEKTETELRYLADHDPLTGLLNRRRFRAELDAHVGFNGRYGGRGAVMIIDIDGLKAVNDELGHQLGDNMLRRVSEILRERVRATDLVARLSGDEFAVLMPQTDVAGALQLGEDLREQVAEGFSSKDEAGMATISLGISMFGRGEVGAEAVLVSADQAMYRAKGEGRNRIALFEAAPAGEEQARRAQSIGARIRDALTQNRLSLATQSIHDLVSGGIDRYELLLRMTAEDGELLPAASFIEAAERSGMVQELDRWVVGRALELLAERERAGGDPISLHVNLSGATMTDLSVLEFIERRLDEGDADPARCTFEITQTARVEDYDVAVGFADRLTEFGCEVAIDDYGAGLGTFAYLKRFPFDVIKIDGAFVRDMPRNDADQLTVKAIVQIARGLGKRTIAEFVEDEDTARLLREYGVDMAQGFHLGRPVDAAEGLATAA